MFGRVIGTFIATLGIGVLFNVPKSELIFCGFMGATSWLIFEILSLFFSTATAPTFFATVIIATVSRVLSRRRKTITTIYLTMGIIPFVPGAGVYRTMYHIIYNEIQYAVVSGVETLVTAGIIAIGVIIVLSLPNKIFEIASPY